VQSLAVKPASAVSSAAGSAAGAMGCFIRTAGNPAARPYLIILLLFTAVVVLAVWRSPSGARRSRNMRDFTS
jgi:hypothetical protein